MANGTSAILVDAVLAAAYNTAPKTKQKKALSAMRGVLRESKPDQIKNLRLSKRETGLFLKINRGLSERQSQRLDELNGKIEESFLTDEEHTELLRLTDRVEKLWVERLRAIIELAKLRGIPPEDLMKQLEIEPTSYAQ